jgi:ribonuclease HI
VNADDPGHPWHTWTDGACEPNPGPAGIGFVIVSPDGVRREGHQGLGDGTNNIAELTAILRVAEVVPESAPLIVHTDSKYAIGVLVQNWKAKANVDLIDRVKQALKKHPSHELEWVKAHATNLENNVADKLSVRAAKAGKMTAPSLIEVSLEKSDLVAEIRKSTSSNQAEEEGAANKDAPLLVLEPKKKP